MSGTHTKAFTMIELVFVIVIIGILAAVAVPRLAATRDDATYSKLMANTKICIEDLVSSYKGKGVMPVMNDFPSCVDAKADGATITYVNDLVHVDDVDDTINNDYIIKGQEVTR